jgi:hypothetical protein
MRISEVIGLTWEHLELTHIHLLDDGVGTATFLDDAVVAGRAPWKGAIASRRKLRRAGS